MFGRMAAVARALFSGAPHSRPAGPAGPLHDEVMTARALVAALNCLRASKGLRRLRDDDRLGRAALNHARFMAHTGSLEHAQPGCVETSDRVLAAGYRWDRLAEFVLADGGRDRCCTVYEALSALTDELDTARLLLSRLFDDVGVGVSRTGTGRRTWCVVLGKSLPEERAALPSALPCCPPGRLVWSTAELEQPGAGPGCHGGSAGT